MSNATTTVNTKNDKATPPAAAKAAAGKEPMAPEGFTRLETDHHMYHPKWCEKAPWQGYLLDLIRLKEEVPATATKPKENAFDVYVIKTTVPCIASKEIPGAQPDNDGKIPQEKYTVPVGKILYVTYTYELAEALKEMHMDPKMVTEVYGVPLGKVPVPKSAGHTMWKWYVASNPSTKALRSLIAPETVTNKLMQAEARKHQITSGVTPKQLAAAPDAPDFMDADKDGR